MFKKLFKRNSERKTGFENMKEVFTDSAGRRYYTPDNDFDLPHARTREIELAIMRISAGLSGSELKLILTAMKKALNGGKKPDTAMIGHLIIEMERREDMVLHPDLLLDLVAYKYIREDEPVTIISKSIHQEKVEQFKKDSREGLRDFFLGAGLSEYVPYLTKLEGEWDEYWKDSEIKIAALNQHLQAYISEAD